MSRKHATGRARPEGRSDLQTDQFRMLIRAKDYGATLAFWEGHLGLERIGGWDRADSSGAVLSTGGNAVVIVVGGGETAYDFPPQEGIYAGIQVDDVDAWYDKLKKTSINIVKPPEDQPWGLRTLRLLDPNGFRLYLFTPQS